LNQRRKPFPPLWEKGFLRCAIAQAIAPHIVEDVLVALLGLLACARALRHI
jgi:hypothetical protein